MRATRTIALLAAALLTCGWAADDVAANFAKAFAEGEASDKKEALRGKAVGRSRQSRIDKVVTVCAR